MSWPFFKPPEPETQKPRPIGLGRVTEWRIWAYDEARPGAKQEYALTRDDVLDIYDAFNSEGLMAHNPHLESHQVRLGLFFVGAAGQAGSSMRQSSTCRKTASGRR